MLAALYIVPLHHYIPPPLVQTSTKINIYIKRSGGWRTQFERLGRGFQDLVQQHCLDIR